MRAAFLVCATLISTYALGSPFTYQALNPPTVFNSGVEVSTNVNNSSGFLQGPQNSTGTVNANVGGAYSINKSVASNASLGIGSATAGATILMNANLTGNSISGTGTLMGNATLGGGSLAGANALTDGAAVFDIYFTLSHPQEVSLDFTATSSDSLLKPDNLAIVSLLGPGSNTLFQVKSTRTGGGNVMWTGMLAPGDYLLRGRDFIDDAATTNNNDPTLYENDESFAFSMQAIGVPEPDTLGLWVAGLLAVAVVQRRRFRKAVDRPA